MHTVWLSLEDSPVYPPRCVACDAPSPDTQLRVGAWDYFGRNYLDRPMVRPVARPPACASCRRDLRRRRFRIYFFSIVLGIASAVAWLLFLDDIPARWRGVSVLGSVIAIPTCTWLALRRHAFSITQPDRNSVHYHFADAEYAKDFADLNNTKVEP